MLQNSFIKLLLVFLMTSISCNTKDKNPVPDESIYFPPVGSTSWETSTLTELNWNLAAGEELKDFLSANDTRAFILLKNGKIVMEEYWGNNIQNNGAFNQNSFWYWASAGKTLTALLIGIAQENGFISINSPTATYLGAGWTSLPSQKENLITVKDQMTMTTGLDFTVANPDCTDPACLQYKTDPGLQWYYHNAPYTLLSQVISQSTERTINQFTAQYLGTKIGINGTWLPQGDNLVYFSTARDAARFGLLLFNKGKWEDTEILGDQAYFQAMTQPSQSLNPAYGYLTWLNGQSSIRVPGLTTSFNLPLSAIATADLYAAMGKNGQLINVVPSENLVIIRLGEAATDDFVPFSFQDEMWSKINAMIRF